MKNKKQNLNKNEPINCTVVKNYFEKIFFTNLIINLNIYCIFKTYNDRLFDDILRRTMTDF